MKNVSKMEEIFETFCTGPEAIAQLLTVYIAEAHPTDEWYIDGMPKVEQHKSIDDRLAASCLFSDQLEGSCLTETIVVDSFDDTIKEAYESWPERLFVIQDGVVVYQGGFGPFGYSPEELRAWLVDYKTNV